VLNQCGFLMPTVLAPADHRQLVSAPCRWVVVDKSPSIAATLLSVGYHPNTVYVAFYGDVLYGRKTLKLFEQLVRSVQINGGHTQFVARTAPNPVTGRSTPEMYGFVLAPQDVGRLTAALQRIVAGDPTPHQWPVFSQYARTVGRAARRRLLVSTTDFTDDTDTVREYHMNWAAMEGAALKEFPRG